MTSSPHAPVARPRSGGRTLRWGAALAVAGLLVLASGCSGVRFYTQSLRGGLEVLLQRQPIEELVADPATPPPVRRGLTTALSARAFASAELHLPENDSYRSYSDLGRPYALWNVVAAPELSMRPVEWCFPFAGCVTYRGYFSRQRAEAFARTLERRGLDVRISPVTAYSTLGWFADPVLNTFVELPAPRLAALVFHELAHQRLYLPGDTTFNESFATVVELAGVERWLEEHGEGDQVAAQRRAKALEARFVDLVLEHRQQLEEIYATDRGKAWKRWHKGRILGELRDAHRRLEREDPIWAAYEPWFSRPLNNADLAAVGAYHRYQEGFQRLLEQCRGELPCFYAAAEELAQASPEERERVLSPPTL
ncbi:MAG: aminopeptidase [Acidobacteriota bacterium]|nr:aminopeptidase [Acidobacteriota bacterium]